MPTATVASLPRHITDTVLRDVETWLGTQGVHRPYPGKYGQWAPAALALFAEITAALARAGAE